MPNPYLPNWEYIPDGEPRVFGDRFYIYGSHDRADSDYFCDFTLKVWSAPVDNPNEWICHGDIFRTKDAKDGSHKSDTPWTEGRLFAPDVVEKDGKYYLYAYIQEARGCVAVSDSPEGPFTLLGQYECDKSEEPDGGIFIDPGVLVDDDGRVYLFGGFLKSFGCELESDMKTVKKGSVVRDIIPDTAPFNFFEACSPRKINGKYFMIYSNQVCSQLVYAVADKPLGPYEYKGVIIDSGLNYPGGNNHGSLIEANGEWFIFYHRMTNGTITSRKGCVERVKITGDTVEQVEPTSQGFEKALNPFKITPAETVCHLTGNPLLMVSERDIFNRPVCSITAGDVLGWKYFDFGYKRENESDQTTMRLALNIVPKGHKGRFTVHLDSPDSEPVGQVDFKGDSEVATGSVKRITGRHAVYLKAVDLYDGPWGESFKGRILTDLRSFVFML